MASVLLASDFDSRCSHAELANERVVPLKQWLNGDWAIVLSDPHDFAPHPSTPSGFVNRLADSVLSAGVKLIAVGHSLEPPAPSWLDHAVNDDSVVLLDSKDRVVDLAERALASRLATLERPFALVLDDKARCRTTLHYRQPAEHAACRMGDLLEIVTTLRDG